MARGSEGRERKLTKEVAGRSGDAAIKQLILATCWLLPLLPPPLPTSLLARALAAERVRRGDREQSEGVSKRRQRCWRPCCTAGTPHGKCHPYCVLQHCRSFRKEADSREDSRALAYQQVSTLLCTHTTPPPAPSIPTVHSRSSPKGASPDTHLLLVVPLPLWHDVQVIGNAAGHQPGCNVLRTSRAEIEAGHLGPGQKCWNRSCLRHC